MIRRWRDASSVIIAARRNFPNFQKQQSAPTDYVVLTAQRSSKSSFLPDGHVFPGGVIEPQNDSSEQWSDLLQKLQFRNLNLHLNDKTSGALNIYKTPKEEQLPRNISLRIAAIRETFEECGILLCRLPTEDKVSKFGHNLILSETEVAKFNSDSSSNKFYELCAQLKCFPDVWSLIEARNWLTPAFFKKRFDTVFFICCLDQTPPVQIDRGEISDFMWGTPQEYLALHKAGKMNLPPPQLYEFNDFTQFDSLQALADAAHNRHFCSDSCFLPVRFLLKDGAVIIMPGDSNYVVDPDEKDVLMKDVTIEDFRKQAVKHHRFEILGKGRVNFVKKL
ncbi:Hypothetical predicted protein [Cloeon dipterum]|uniref:Nudix hydrolase domain-containing protein n=2 Tax=Cloeon dipterum TaxID=197152 RepID=A0A8S1BSI4_9INSE|nr:Hypothetical predicted protein [Cloeon dipterum]